MGGEVAQYCIPYGLHLGCCVTWYCGYVCLRKPCLPSSIFDVLPHLL
jgi:hypothetical protein